ncbi:unnamed protein product, partial [Prorocentrum cordatum]
MQSATSALQSQFKLVISQVQQQNQRIDGIDTCMRDLDSHTHITEQEQQQLKADIERTQSPLAMAMATLPPLDMAALAARDRPPDPHLYSIGAPPAVQPAEVRRSLKPWLSAEGASISDVEFIGDVPARRFFLRVLGHHFFDSISLAALEIGSSAAGSARLRWGGQVAQRLRVDNAAVAAEFQRLFRVTDTTA